MNKTCVSCGRVLERPKKYSAVQWSGAKTCSRLCSALSQQGISKRHRGSFRKGFDRRRIVQKKQKEHYLWKGEDASYSSKHKWIVKTYGKAAKCVQCGSEKTVDWANISKRYLRERSDYKELCRKCHAAFDRDEIMAKRNKRTI